MKHLEKIIKKMLQAPPAKKTLNHGLNLAYSETENMKKLTLSRKSYQKEAPIYPSPAEIEIVTRLLTAITGITPTISARGLIHIPSRIKMDNNGQYNKMPDAWWGYQTLSWSSPTKQQPPLITAPTPINYKD